MRILLQVFWHTFCTLWSVVCPILLTVIRKLAPKWYLLFPLICSGFHYQHLSYWLEIWNSLLNTKTYEWQWIIWGETLLFIWLIDSKHSKYIKIQWVASWYQTLCAQSTFTIKLARNQTNPSFSPPPTSFPRPFFLLSFMFFLFFPISSCPS